MDREHFCTLHSEIAKTCYHRQYDQQCSMVAEKGFSVTTCQYRMEAVIIELSVAEEKEESPVNVPATPQVVQEPQDIIDKPF